MILHPPTTTAPTTSIYITVRSLESRPLREPRVMIEWQLPAGDGLFEFGLLIGYTIRSWKPFLPLGYPGLDIFRCVQG